MIKVGSGCVGIGQVSRYFLAIGLPDAQLNRTIADRKAKLIERDILTNLFDPTLAKYSPQALDKALVTAVDLFEE